MSLAGKAADIVLQTWHFLCEHEVVYAEAKKPDTGGVLWVNGINQLFMASRLKIFAEFVVWSSCFMLQTVFVLEICFSKNPFDLLHT